MLTQKEAMTLFRNTVYKDVGRYFKRMNRDAYDCWQVFIDILLENDMITNEQAYSWLNPLG